MHLSISVPLMSLVIFNLFTWNINSLVIFSVWPAWHPMPARSQTCILSQTYWKPEIHSHQWVSLPTTWWAVHRLFTEAEGVQGECVPRMTSKARSNLKNCWGAMVRPHSKDQRKVSFRVCYFTEILGKDRKPWEE